MNTSRRSLLKGGIIASMATGFAAMPAIASAAEETKFPQHTYDLVIAGLGIGGIVTSLLGMFLFSAVMARLYAVSGAAASISLTLCGALLRDGVKFCPECGRVYVSGGTTRTTTASEPDTAEAMQQQDGKNFSAAA